MYYFGFCHTYRFFVIVNAIACGYFALSIPISILHIGRSRARKSRIILIFMDTVKTCYSLYLMQINCINTKVLLTFYYT